MSWWQSGKTCAARLGRQVALRYSARRADHGATWSQSRFSVDLLLSGIALLVTGYPGVPALAAATDSDLATFIATCRSVDLAAEDRVAACSALLATPALNPKTAALLHFYRGLAEVTIRQDANGKDIGLAARALVAMPDIDAAISLDPDLIAAYRYRVNLHRYANQYDAAAADTEKLIDVYPQIAGLHALRGSNLVNGGHIDAARPEYETALSLAASKDEQQQIYAKRVTFDDLVGQWDQALDDLDVSASSAKTPRRLFWVTETRGRLEFMAGKYDAALADLNKAQGLAKESDQYYLLWLYLAEAHSGQDAAHNLYERLPFTDTRSWPGPILRYFAGDITLDQMKPTDDISARQRIAATCESEFFLGELALLKGDRAAAARHFHQSVDTGITDYVEYNSAQAELKRLAP